MRLLIYGAGVIGSLYATLFSQAGYDVTVYARGKRLEALKEKGLIFLKKEKQYYAKVHIISKLFCEDTYDFIFLTVKGHQVYEALRELKENQSNTIVTMVNSLDDYDSWENICGKGRILPAFPGAGGSIEEDVLDASLTPGMIQKTSFAEIGGENSERVRKLQTVFQRSRIPYQIVPDMHIWQICHLAVVVPIGDAYYETECPQKVGKNFGQMLETARQIKENCKKLYRSGMKLSPGKINLFRILPVFFLGVGLSVLFNSNFGDKFMYRHSMKAPDEMKQLHRWFYEYLSQREN